MSLILLVKPRACPSRQEFYTPKGEGRKYDKKGLQGSVLLSLPVCGMEQDVIRSMVKG